MEIGLAWFVRRMNDPEILNHIGSIVDEGFDYTKPCDHINDKKRFVDEILNGSALTFLYSYDELDKLSDSGKVFIYRFIETKFNKMITDHYDYWTDECDD